MAGRIDPRGLVVPLVVLLAAEAGMQLATASLCTAAQIGG